MLRKTQRFPPTPSSTFQALRKSSSWVRCPGIESNVGKVPQDRPSESRFRTATSHHLGLLVRILPRSPPIAFPINHSKSWYQQLLLVLYSFLLPYQCKMLVGATRLSLSPVASVGFEKPASSFLRRTMPKRLHILEHQDCSNVQSRVMSSSSVLSRLMVAC